MGAFYVNYTVANASQKSVARYLSRRKAFVSREQNGALVVFDQESDGQDERVIAKLATQLSSFVHCTVFAVLLHDSDILRYQLYQRGRLRDEYNSTPDYWSSTAEPSGPKGGDAVPLCTAFGCSEVTRVESILRAPTETYVFAEARHADLVEALKLPPLALGYGFRDILRGNLPKGLSSEDITATN